MSVSFHLSVLLFAVPVPFMSVSLLSQMILAFSFALLEEVCLDALVVRLVPWLLVLEPAVDLSLLVRDVTVGLLGLVFEMVTDFSLLVKEVSLGLLSLVLGLVVGLSPLVRDVSMGLLGLVLEVVEGLSALVGDASLALMSLL